MRSRLDVRSFTLVFSGMNRYFYSLKYRKEQIIIGRGYTMHKYLLVIAALFMLGCGKKQEPQIHAAAPPPAGGHQVVIQEVVPVTEYTYIRVKEGDQEYWMAGPKSELNVGETLSYGKAMEMKNFKSKELNKTFDVILFVDSFKADQGTHGNSSMMASPQKPKITEENIQVEKAAGGITIAQLYADPNAYANKIVKIKGQVVKVNTAIMDRNWVHIQDGTKNGNDFDLTITTQDEVNKDEIVTFSGKIVLNKDFGYGYSYKVLMEEAKVEIKPSAHKTNI
jgi:hypothetical protein